MAKPRTTSVPPLHAHDTTFRARQVDGHVGGELIGDKQEIAGIAVEVIECVMLNSNRDHFSTPQQGAHDPARELFGTMVALRKNQFCAEFCRQHGLVEDERGYVEALGSERAHFRKLTGVPSPI